MHSLAQNLQQSSRALTEKQERERQQWEAALSRDQSSDPLSVWLKYIKWTKHNFASATNQKAQLLPLIERCTRRFKDDERYKNNKKYIKLWLEYSHLSQDSAEIFQFMHSNQIGHGLALFWRGWAIIAEQQRQFDLVDRIFTEAKAVGAQPMKDLNKSYNSYLARMRRKVRAEGTDCDDGDESRPQRGAAGRTALGQIADDDPSHRNGPRPKARGFGTALGGAQQNEQNAAFGVYRDGEENDRRRRNDGRYLAKNSDIALPSAASGWKTLGTERGRKKENNRVPRQWNDQGLGASAALKAEGAEREGFAIPMDAEFEPNSTHSAPPRPAALAPRPLAARPRSTFEDGHSASTHCWRPRGQWTQCGRYKVASFHDPKLLTFDGEICSLEEARCRAMRPVWNQQMDGDADGDAVGSEEDDMMMTVNVGRIFYSKHGVDLSIPSTIKEEPSECKTDIRTDAQQTAKRRGRKRRDSDEPMPPIDGHDDAMPSTKRFRAANAAADEPAGYDIFHDDELTVTQRTATLNAHYDTPLRRLDFNKMTPALVARTTNATGSTMAGSMEQTETISMTEFFKNPIQITDRRACDTPTVHRHPTKHSKLLNATQTVTFHSKAALNDVVAMFGDDSAREQSVQSVQPTPLREDTAPFPVYEDTATIHCNVHIGGVDDSAHKEVGRLSIGSMGGTGGGPPHSISATNQTLAHCEEPQNDLMDDDELQLALPAVAESDDSGEEQREERSPRTSRPATVDPTDEVVVKEYECQLQRHLVDANAVPNIFDERDGDGPPVSIENLLAGATDIELDDDDGYLNVTEYVESASTAQRLIFCVNDLSQDDDTERMLVVDSPSSLRAFHLSQTLRQSLSEQSDGQFLSTQFAVVETVYVYSDCSFSLCRTVDAFNTIDGMISAANAQSANLHEKLCLFYIAEIMRITALLHKCNVVHCDLSLSSFLLKFAESDSIPLDWDGELGTGWEHQGLMLQDLSCCVALGDFVNLSEPNTGCLVDGSRLDSDRMAAVFQKLIGRHTPWCFEVDHFSVFVIVVQLLTQKTSADGVLSDILAMAPQLTASAVMQYVEGVRAGNGLDALQNVHLWHRILNMLLMRKEDDSEQNGNGIYSFREMAIAERRQWMARCYELCAAELVDLENLSPKLRILVARLDMMIRD